MKTIFNSLTDTHAKIPVFINSEDISLLLRAVRKEQQSLRAGNFYVTANRAAKLEASIREQLPPGQQ